MTFYIEQLFLLPGKLDETERQIIPSTHPPAKYCFYFPVETFEFSKFTKRQICIVPLPSAFVKIIKVNDASSVLAHIHLHCISHSRAGTHLACITILQPDDY